MEMYFDTFIRNANHDYSNLVLGKFSAEWLLFLYWRVLKSYIMYSVSTWLLFTCFALHWPEDYSVCIDAIVLSTIIFGCASYKVPWFWQLHYCHLFESRNLSWGLVINNIFNRAVVQRKKLIFFPLNFTVITKLLYK